MKIIDVLQEGLHELGWVQEEHSEAHFQVHSVVRRIVSK